MPSSSDCCTHCTRGAHYAGLDTALSRSCSFCNLDERISRSVSANDTLVSSCRCSSAASANRAFRSSALNREGCDSTTARSGPRPIQQSVAGLLNTYVTPAEQQRQGNVHRVNATHAGFSATAHRQSYCNGSSSTGAVEPALAQYMVHHAAHSLSRRIVNTGAKALRAYL